MKDRIQQILAEKNLSASKFAEKIDVQPSGISHIISGRNKPGMDFIVKCLNAFPDINPDWFVLGKGPIYRTREESENTGKINSKLDLHDMEKMDEQDTAERSVEGSYKRYATKNAQDDLFSLSDSIKVGVSIDASSKPYNAVNNSPVRNFASDRRRIQRVMIFYSDHTVESFDYSENL